MLLQQQFCSSFQDKRFNNKKLIVVIALVTGKGVVSALSLPQLSLIKEVEQVEYLNYWLVLRLHYQCTMHDFAFSTTLITANGSMMDIVVVVGKAEVRVFVWGSCMY